MLIPFAGRLVALALCAAAVAGRSARGDDWPTFRGANRTAVAPDTDLLESWPEGGPTLVWTAAGAGRGYASPTIVGEKIFTLGDGPSTAPEDKDEYLGAATLENKNRSRLERGGYILAGLAEHPHRRRWDGLCDHSPRPAHRLPGGGWR